MMTMTDEDDDDLTMKARAGASGTILSGKAAFVIQKRQKPRYNGNGQVVVTIGARRRRRFHGVDDTADENAYQQYQ